MSSTMRSKKAIILAAVLTVVIGGAYAAYQIVGPSVASNQLAVQDAGQDGEQDGSAEVEPAPDFTAYDADGNEVRLSDFAGKPVVLNFWASWCGPCQMEMPHFEEAYQTYGGSVQFLMVNMTDGSRETAETAAAFIAEQGYTFPVLFDTDLAAATTYQAYSLPTTYFINADGYALARATGAIDADTLQEGIDLIS